MKKIYLSVLFIVILIFGIFSGLWYVQNNRITKLLNAWSVNNKFVKFDQIQTKDLVFKGFPFVIYVDLKNIEISPNAHFEEYIDKINLEHVQVKTNILFSNFRIINNDFIKLNFKKDLLVKSLLLKLENDLKFSFTKKKIDQIGLDDFWSSIKKLEYKDSKLQVFNQEKNVIYQTSLDNNLSIIQVLPGQMDVGLQIKKTKMIPFEFSINSVIDYTNSQQVNIKINQSELSVYSLKLNASGFFEVDVLDECKEEYCFPYGELGLQVYGFEQTRKSVEMFFGSEHIQKTLDHLINLIAVTQPDNSLSILYEYKKNDEYPKLGGQNLLELIKENFSLKLNNSEND